MTTFSEYLEFVKRDKLEPVRAAIFTHPDPDPDAMGSCLGMKWLLAKLGVESDIFFEGDYSSRRQNTAMVNVLGITMKPIADFLKQPESMYSMCMTLDCTHKRLPEQVAKRIDSIIDHHCVSVDTSSFNFVVNRRAGACCSLVFEIMQEMECLPVDANADSIVANAMLAGIRADTDMYRREDTCTLDYLASTKLFAAVDMDVIQQIERCKLPRYHFELRSEIIKPGNYDIVNGSTFIGCVGYISSAKMASIPILADEVVNDMEGISTSIIFAMVDDRVELRMRSSDVSVEVSKFLQRHFGDFAGAKYGSGGATIPLGILGMPNPPAELRKNIFETTKSVIMTVLSRDVKSE
jgi:nanoRNase/pAp phosphatase (c-di-AMP/oligoRNAs hydrolase)